MQTTTVTLHSPDAVEVITDSASKERPTDMGYAWVEAGVMHFYPIWRIVKVEIDLGEDVF
jgi:hypothetical protein